MNVLFYLAPVTEVAHPLQKLSWYTDWVPRLKSDFASTGLECSCTIVVSEDIASEIRRRSLARHGDIVALSQRELLRGYTVNANKETTIWQETGRSTEWGTYLAGLIASRLPAGYMPDVVISFSPAPFFRDRYPRALCVVREFSVFSRYPYPATFAFDPVGKGPRFLPSVSAAKVNSFRFSERSGARLKVFRKKIDEALRANSFIARYMRGLRGRFKRLFVLALSYENYYDTSAFSPYQGQFEFIEHVMDSVDVDTGVLVTQHPYFSFVRRSSLDELKVRYPNLVSDDIFYNIPCFSQFALPYCDGAITQASTVGLQAAFLGKYFVSIGGYYSGIADCTDLSKMGEMLACPPKDRDAFFLWHVTRYALLEEEVPRFIREVFPKLSEIQNLSPDEMVEKWPEFIPEDELEDRFFRKAEANIVESAPARWKNSIELFRFREDGTCIVPPVVCDMTDSVDGFMKYVIPFREGSPDRGFRLDFGKQHVAMLVSEFTVRLRNGAAIDLLSDPALHLHDALCVKTERGVFFIPESDDPQFTVVGLSGEIAEISLSFREDETEEELLFICARRLEAEVAELKSQKTALAEEVSALRCSASWKVTRPFRRIFSSLSGRTFNG